MILSPEDLQVFRPAQGYVLTTAATKPGTIKAGETELYVDTTYNPAAFQPIIQRVVSVCKILNFGRTRRFIEIDGEFDPSRNHRRKDVFAVDVPVPHCCPWDTDIEVKAGDIVYCDNMATIGAVNQGRTIECEDKTYYLLKYEDLYLKLVDGVPQMLNGWILAAPVTKAEDDMVKSLKSHGLVFPSIAINNDNRKEYGQRDKLATVRYLGPPVREYLEEMEDTDAINVGDTIVLQFGANRRLESEGNRFFSQEELIVTRRPRIMAVVRDELF